MSDNNNKPKLKITGTDGNAFALIGKVRQAGKKAGFSQEKISEIQNKMMAGDYDNLLNTISDYFEVS